ncbi:MAG: cell division protein ZapA [Syntrophobacterales bacterium]|nr:cell division protein ZapA [Syntrophobacterales bacterium]
MVNKRFEFNILGQQLSVVSDSGDEHVANVIRYVGSKVEEVQKSAGSNTLTVAILAALNIADEYLQIAEKNEHIYENLESKAEQLIRSINETR